MTPHGCVSEKLPHLACTVLDLCWPADMGVFSSKRKLSILNFVGLSPSKV